MELLSSSSCDEVGFDGDVRNMRDDRAARMKSFLKSDNGATGSSSDSETGLCSRAMESDLENVVSFHNLVAILGPDADHPLPVSSHDCDIVLVDDTSIPAGHWLTSPQQQVVIMCGLCLFVVSYLYYGLVPVEVFDVFLPWIFLLLKGMGAQLGFLDVASLSY